VVPDARFRKAFGSFHSTSQDSDEFEAEQAPEYFPCSYKLTLIKLKNKTRGKVLGVFVNKRLVNVIS